MAKKEEHKETKPIWTGTSREAHSTPGYTVVIAVIIVALGLVWL